MILKIYGLIWAIGILAMGITYLTGFINLLAIVVFGFLTFSAIYMGIISVLPLVFSTTSESKSLKFRLALSLPRK